MPARSPFTQASAAMPTQNVTDLDALQADIERKRRMAELLQSQQFKGMQLASPNAPASILNALAPIMQAWAGKSEQDDLKKQEQELAAKRSERLSQLLGEMPQGTEIPGDPGQAAADAVPPRLGMPTPPAPPSAPAPTPAMPPQMGQGEAAFGPKPGANPLAAALMQGAPPEAGGGPPPSTPPVTANPLAAPGPADNAPLLPGRPIQGFVPPTPPKMVPADPALMLKWGANLAGQGGPVGQKIGEQVTAAATKNLVPDQEKFAQLNADRELRGQALTLADENKKAQLEAYADAKAAQAENAAASIEQRREAKAAETAARLQIAQMMAAVHRGNKTRFQHAGFDPNTDEGVTFNPDTGELKTASGKPPSGPLVTTGQASKVFLSSMQIDRNIKNLDDIEKAVKEQPGAVGGFGAFVSNAASKADPVFGAEVATQIYSDKELAARTKLAKQMAVSIKEAYGVAVSKGEKSIADKWVPGSEDTIETLTPKLQAARDYLQNQRDALPQGLVQKPPGSQKNVTVSY